MNPELLQAVLDDPADDAVRLVLADWLEENGEADRAEFIRVEVELAATPSGCAVVLKRDCNGSCAEWCLRCRLVRRELGLLESRQPGNSVGGPSANTRDSARYVWADPVTRLLDMGCRGWTFRRGFVEDIFLSCAAWLDHGPALVRAQPIMNVRLTNRKPHLEEDGLWRWYAGYEAADAIPAGIAKAMTPAIRTHGAFALGNEAAFPSRESACAALSAACLRWAWREAWKCPECGGCGHIARPPRWASDPVPCGDCHGAGVLRAAPASLNGAAE